MRKAFLALLVGVALVAASLPVEAQQADLGKYLGAVDFGFRGFYRIWSFDSDNTYDFDKSVGHSRGNGAVAFPAGGGLAAANVFPNTEDGRHYIFQRFNWYLDTSFQGKFGGTIGMEHDWIWGSDQTNATAGGVNTPVTGGAARGDDLINGKLKHAYVWFFIPSTPVKITAGLQGLWNDPNNIMWSRDDYFGVRFDTPLITNVLNLSGGWIKLNEGNNGRISTAPSLANSPIENDLQRDDVDMYVLKLDGNLSKTLRVGAYTQYAHVKNGASHNLDENTGSATAGGRPFARMINGDYWWQGLHFNWTPGMFFLAAHGNYFWGDVDNTDNKAPGATVPAAAFQDIRNPSGWAALMHTGIRTGPWEIGFRGAYFSGQDITKNGENWSGWSTVDAFHGQFELIEGGYKSWPGGWSTYTSAPRGHAYAALDTTWQATKQLSLNLLAGYLWATDDRDKGYAALFKPGRQNSFHFNNSTNLGVEADLTATYKIYSNLTLDLGFAYLWAGEGLDHNGAAAATYFANGAAGGLAAGPVPILTPAQQRALAQFGRGESDNAWEFFWRLTYAF